RDLGGRLDKRIASLDAPGTTQQARVLEAQENLLEKDDRHVLAVGDLLPRDRVPVVLGQLDQGPKPVFAFLREFHGLMLTKSVDKVYIRRVYSQEVRYEPTGEKRLPGRS